MSAGNTACRVVNANYAWLQNIHWHLASYGTAGFVLANGSMASDQSGEGEIRKKLIEADLVDGMVALPDQLFYATQIPACLWFLAQDKSKRAGAHGVGAHGCAPLPEYCDILGFCRPVTIDEIRRQRTLKARGGLL